MTGTDLRGFFDLNVRRQAAARDYLHLFCSNDIDAILMPPAPHTALPLDQWTTASYTGLWNYLDYPAVVIPVDTVCESDLADDLSNARYGAEDARVYSLCMHSPSLPVTVLRILKLIFMSFQRYRYWNRTLQRRSYLCSASWVSLCGRSANAYSFPRGFNYQWCRMNRALL